MKQHFQATKKERVAAAYTDVMHIIAVAVHRCLTD